MTKVKPDVTSETSINIMSNANPFTMLPIKMITEIARHTVTVGTRGNATIDTCPHKSQVALLGIVAMSQGYNLEMQHSVKQVLSVREKLTGKRVVTVYNNSDKGEGCRVFLNALGTKTPFDKLSTLTGIPVSELKADGQWQVAHTGAIERLACWQADINSFTDLLNKVAPTVKTTSNKQPG